MQLQKKACLPTLRSSSRCRALRCARVASKPKVHCLFLAPESRLRFVFISISIFCNKINDLMQQVKVFGMTRRIALQWHEMADVSMRGMRDIEIVVIDEANSKCCYLLFVFYYCCCFVVVQISYLLNQ